MLKLGRRDRQNKETDLKAEWEEGCQVDGQEQRKCLKEHSKEVKHKYTRLGRKEEKTVWQEILETDFFQGR